MIVSISGQIGSGKDTFCQLYQKHSQRCWDNKKFAYKLKLIVALLTGCKVEDLEDDDFKNSYLPEVFNKKVCRSFHGDSKICSTYRYTYREFLQQLGTDLLRDQFHPQVWINGLFVDYKEIDNKFPDWMITDLRFKNELEASKKRKSITIRVERKMLIDNWLKSKYFNKIKLKEINSLDFSLLVTKSVMVDTIKNYVIDVKDPEWLKVIHSSETDLNKSVFDYIIFNDSTLEDFELKIKNLVKEIEK